jgi:hypothetical protein
MGWSMGWLAGYTPGWVGLVLFFCLDLDLDLKVGNINLFQI